MKIRKEYRIALGVCPTPLMLMTRDGTIVLTNRRFDVLFGYAEGELQGQSVDVLVPDEARHFHPELRDAFFQVPTNRAMGTGRDLFGVSKDGEKIPLEIGLDPFDHDGETMVMVSALDIRQRKRDEEKLRRAINAASSAMVMVNEHGRIELINQQTRQLFGYEDGELIGEKIECLVPERYRRRHDVYRTNYQSQRDRRSMGVGRELFGVTKDGSEFPVEIGLTPIDGAQGRLIMATIIDITGRKLNEQRIQKKNEELQRLNTELKEFAYSASHDLKAPLSSIAAILAFCESDLEAGSLDEVRENIQQARELAARLSARIEDMLALAQADSLGNNWAPIPLDELVEEIWQGLKGGPQGAVQLTTDFQHKEPIVTIPARISIILENILGNAVKYRDKRKAEPWVRIESREEAGVLQITVSDNGIGIPPEHHEKIFQLFKRVADSDEPGSGLGLALVKKNLMFLGGDISVQSTDAGTAFTITLPQNDRGAAQDAEPPQLEAVG